MSKTYVRGVLLILIVCKGTINFKKNRDNGDNSCLADLKKTAFLRIVPIVSIVFLKNSRSLCPICL